MTESLFFDNDCLAAFLWVGEQSLLTQMYPGRIVIPKPVYDELSVPGIEHIKRRIDAMIANNEVELRAIDTDSPIYDLYYTMTQEPTDGHKIIGNGEAACIAFAKEENGILASNNFSDILDYVAEFSLDYITTGDILVEAYNRNLITEQQGNKIWQEMLRRRRKIGANSFTEYLHKHTKKNNP